VQSELRNVDDQEADRNEKYKVSSEAGTTKRPIKNEEDKVDSRTRREK
jgi:hypothetical protein